MNYLNTLLIPALILGLVTLNACNPDDHAHDKMSPEELEQHVLEIHTDEEGNIVYTCSMHPEVRLNEPGNCPICGMTLIPVGEPMPESDSMQMDASGSSETSASDSMEPTSASMLITPRQQQLIGVQFDTVKSRNLVREIRTVGRLTHAEPNLTDIITRVGGYIEEAMVTETGTHVHEGQNLVTVYSPELVSAQQDYLVARRGSNQRLAEQARERLHLLNIPEEEIERLESTGEVLMNVTLTAPSSGHIMISNVRSGMPFEPGATLYRINDHSQLWLLADIYEEDFPFIHLGQRVMFTVQGQPGKMYEGLVSFIPPNLNKNTRTLQVRVEVPNPDYDLRMDQFADVRFREELYAGLSIHRDAVLTTGNRTIVFRESEPGRFQPVEIVTGPMAEDYYLVLEGLNEGDRIVTSGRFFLDAESRLQGIGSANVHNH